MSKAAVIFWSQTGNTEQMANRNRRRHPRGAAWKLTY